MIHVCPQNIQLGRSSANLNNLHRALTAEQRVFILTCLNFSSAHKPIWNNFHNISSPNASAAEMITFVRSVIAKERIEFLHFRLVIGNTSFIICLKACPCLDFLWRGLTKCKRGVGFLWNEENELRCILWRWRRFRVRASPRQTPHAFFDHSINFCSASS